MSFILLLPNILMQKWYIVRIHTHIKKLQKLVDKLSENNKLTEEEVAEKNKQLTELSASMQKYEKQQLIMQNFPPKGEEI